MNLFPSSMITMLFANQDISDVDVLIKNYSGELMILILFILIAATLMVLVPQLLRAALPQVRDGAYGTHEGAGARHIHSQG